eukprot:TRINITY_DN2597_c0_g1_i1.p1 TRINITY_DN2597_c0_g1~~TRINITY_DN2597_c0_g1_i1.p1  ORF type:complete len:266 (-),score=68.57 TRINITY_DN2597_c0_g1_i1:24-740(-)
MAENKQSVYTAAERNVSFKVDGAEDLKGYFSPHGKDSKMGVVIIQEWWGMNQSIQHYADRFGQKGYRALVPDLYRGKVAKDHEEAGHYMNDLDFSKAVSDIRGAVQFLFSSGCSKVGVVGYCMGGALTILTAVNVPEVNAAVSYHGIPPMDKWDAKNIKCPMQFHFGNEDKMAGFSDPKTANALEEKLKAANVRFEFYRYDGCDHAFTNEDRPAVYNEKQSNLAWERTFQFFEKNLAS